VQENVLVILEDNIADFRNDQLDILIFPFARHMQQTMSLSVCNRDPEADASFRLLKRSIGVLHKWIEFYRYNKENFVKQLLDVMLQRLLYSIF
jgi:hypothetical protein